MKKSTSVVLIAIVAIVSLFVVSCGSDPFYHSVTVKDGDTIIDSQIVYDNFEYQLPSEPSKRGQVFEGWKSSVEGYNLKAGATVKITSDVTFTAVWGDEIKTPDVSSIQTQIEAGKVFKSTDSITLPAPADGVTYHWTLDDTEPTATTETTGSSISLANVAGQVTLKVVAEKDGYLSETATISLKVEPVITFDDYSTVKLGQKDSVKLSVPTGTAVYYTTDGSVPTTESSTYDPTTGISLAGLTGSTTIKALAVKDEVQSTKELSINVLLPEPEINADTQKTYDQDGKVSLDDSSVADTTEVIRYTLDGTEPTKDSPAYSATDGIKLDGQSGNVVIKAAIFREDGERCSDISNVTVKVQPKQPEATVDSTTPYDAKNKITVTGMTGTTIYYTTDGTAPTTSSTEATNGEIPLTGLSGKVTIKAIAVKDDLISEVKEIKDIQVKPAITLDKTKDAELTATDTISVTVPDSKNTTVYYTTDGTDPTTATTTTGTSIPVTGLVGDTTIKILAVKDGVESDVSSLSVKVKTTAPEVKEDTTTTTYKQTDKITIDVPAGAEVRYTINGENPTATTGTVYDATTGIPLSGNSGNVTVKAVVCKGGKTWSDVSTTTVKVQPTTPVVTAATTAYEVTDKLTVSTTYDANTKIYYTTNGTAPTASSTEATNGEIPLTGLSGKVTIKAIAVKDGVISDVKEIKDVQVKPTIAFDKQKDEVVSVNGAVKINVPTGTTVYYTTDGTTEPTTSSTEYNSETGIPLTGLIGKTTIKVLADKDGVTSTGEIEVDVKLPGPTVNESTTETYKQTDKVTIDVPSGAEVRYTIDGENPTATSTKYDTSTGIKLDGHSGDVVIKAATYKDGALCSAVSTITVKVQPATPSATVLTTPYAATDNITVTGMTGTTIYYTTDGNTPTTSSATATNGEIPLTGLSGKVTIKAIAVKDGIVSEVKEIKDIQVKPATLTLTRPESAYSVTDKITFSDLDNSTKVYYTTDGSNPSTNTSTTTSKTETDGHSIALTDLSGKVTIKAIAVKDDVVSEIATFTDVEIKPTITFDTEAGKSVGKDKVVKITVPSGTTAYYTTDNSDPETSATKTIYSDSNGIALSALIGETTIKIYAEKDEVGSTSELSIKVIPATPSTGADSDDSSKVYTTSDKITVTVPTGSDAYYTFGDNAPTTASPKYDGTGISLEGQAGEVKLNIIIKEGDEISEVKTITVKVQPTISFGETAEGSDVGTDETIKLDVPSGTSAYYTTDGSDPSDESNTNRKLYTEAGISVADKNGNTTIKVHADKDGVTSDKTLNVTVKPAAPATGADDDDSTKIYTKDDKITVTVPTGATCYYTLDGSDPSTSATKQTYDGTGISLDGQSGEVKIKVMVTKDGQNSKVKELTVKVQPDVTLSTSASSTTTPLNQTSTINVTVPNSSNTDIYYTTDGTTPTVDSETGEVTGTKATGTTIPVSGLVGDVTVKVLAVKDGVCSEVKDIEVSVNANDPEIKEDTANTYKQTDKVTIDVPAGAEVRYTINGDAPTATTGTVYDAEIGISLSEKSGNVIIKAVVCKDGETWSEVTTTTVKVQPTTPEATVATTSYDSTGKLTVSTSYDENTTIYYTTDGTDPAIDASGAVTGTTAIATNGEIPLSGLSGKVTIKVIAIKDGIVSEVKELKDVKVKPLTPTYRPEQTPYEATAKISGYTNYDEYTKIYYTTDGTDPTTSSTETTDGKIPLAGLSGKITIKVIAVKDGVISEVTELNDVQVKPAITLDKAKDSELTVDDTITVTVPDSANTTVYYTTDGTDPTTATTTTGTSIPLTGLVGNVAIKVLAVKDDVSSSITELSVKVKPKISFDYSANADVRQDQNVTVTVSDGVNVYYTTDGTTEPTTSSTKATDGKIDLSAVTTGSTTIKILAEKDGVTATSELTINVKLALPVVSVDEETTYTQSDSVTFTVPSGASVYYTTDGSDPADANNANRKKYSTDISLDGLSGEVKLRAVVVNGSETSDEKSLTLKVQPKTPTYEGATKTTYAESEALAFDASSDAETYYTLDGSDPATSATRKQLDSSKSIPLAGSLGGIETGTVTVKVVSIKDNVVSEPTILNLNVSSKVVTITYVLEGGTITATSYETNAAKGSNTSITLLTASQVSKTGYALDGWYTEATPSTSNYAGTTVTLNNDNVTLYAHWVDDLKYTVSGSSVSVGPGNATGDVVIPSIYQGKTVTKLDSFMMNTDITSVYIPSTVTTIIDFSMDSSLKTVTIEGKALTSIPDGAFEGCEALETIIFKVNKTDVAVDCSASSIRKWMGTSTDITPTIIYGDTHTVTVYDADGSVLVETYYVDADVTVTKPSVEPTVSDSDKIFKYWTADGTNEFVFGKTITEDIELRPYVKVREKLTLTYELNGGNTSESCTVSIMEGEDSSEITLLTPTKSGYDFDGWYTKNPEDATVTATELAASYISTSTLNLAKNTTLYAHWVDTKLDYDDSSDTVSVEKYNSDITGDVVIPNVYHGKLVTEIEYAAFADSDGIKITSITIPDTVEKIGDYAFAWSTLSKVEFTGNCKITEISNRAFFKCSSLTEIEIPSSVTTIAGKSFAQTSLTSLTIPNNVTTIGNTDSDSIIDSCTSLETITFEEGSRISTIYDNAFANCASLKTIIFKSNDADITVAHTEADIDKWTGSMSPRPTVVFNDTHKITYLNEDGTVFSTQYVSSTTTKISETPVITAEGKIFAYWSIDGTTEYVFGQTISEDIVLKPAVKDGIALTYVLNGGKITASSYVTQADETTPITVLTASDVSRDGYTFDGWYTKNPEDATVSAADVATSYYSDSTVTLTKSVILYANWVDNKLTYTDNSGTISVKAKDASTLTGEVVIPRVYQGKLVTAIEKAAFAGGEEDYCQIKSIVIPDSVETIGSAAFYSTTLEKVEFTGESKIKEIPGYAFIYCQNLTEINIPQSVETIGENAFCSCYALTSDILAGTKVVTIGEYAFRMAKITKITIPYTVTSIGKGAFRSCSDLVTVVFAKSEEGKTAQITAIADETFCECNDLTAIEIPATVTSIGNQVFHNTNLTSFTFEEGSVIESLGSELFTNSGTYCKFTTISIPGTIKSIESDTFSQCNYLTSIYVDRDEPVEGDTDYAKLVGTKNWGCSATITWKDSVAVTINYNNGSASTVKNIKKGTSITKPSDPTYTGYDFVAWTTEDGNEYDFSSTISEATTIVAKWATAYEVGDVGPAGGYIIYVNPNYTKGSWKYLEVTEEDLIVNGVSKFAYGGYGTIIGGNATSLTIGAGDANTKAIVDALGTSGNYAALVCSNYFVEKDGKKYTGWYLPNSGELALVYNLKTSFPSLETTWATDGLYWTSSEITDMDNEAAIIDFNTSSKAYYIDNNKNNTYAVRAIRKVNVGE